MELSKWHSSKYGNPVDVSPEQKHSFLGRDLEKRKEQQRFRSLHALKPDMDGITVMREGRDLINFCSNDYLGLSKHPDVRKRAARFTETFGAGSTSSRLIAGTYEIHEQLEQQLADVFQGEAALLFNSGFQANSTIVSTLTNRHSLVLADKLSHNSLLQGALLSRAELQRFEHNHLKHLEQLLQESGQKSYNRILIITETVFSMDGDRSDVETIAGLAAEYGALLFADDAHAAGVWGDKGLGLAKGISGIDILLGTCGKAFGSFGSYVICSEKMKDYLINFCPGFIYTTALPPAVIGAIEASLELIPAMNDLRASYYELIHYFVDGLHDLGYDTGRSTTQIIPVIVGDEKETLDLEEYLFEQGILATAIRPPTVPRGSSRIRFTLTAAHKKAHVNKLLKCLEDWNDE